MVNSRQKGARGEREFRDWLIDRGHKARRGQQFAGGNDSPDVVTDLDELIHWEVKRTESCSPYKYLEQAIDDAKVTQIPVVVHKQSRKDWIAFIRAEDLLKLIENQRRQAEIRTDFYEPHPQI
jgi:hypothetical protein